MSGYFSQLARSTGLSIDRSRTGPMPGLPVAPVAAPSRDTGLEVEEVVLVAPQTDSNSELKTSVQSDEGANHLHVSEKTAVRNAADDAIDATDLVRMNSESTVDHKASQDSLSEQSNVNAEPPLTFDAVSTFVVEQEIDSREPHDQLLPEPREPSISIQPIERIELVTRDVRTDESFTSESNTRELELNNVVTEPRALSANAQSDSLASPVERARFDQPQLKEVIAWVTANPTNIQEEPSMEIFIPSRNVPGHDSADHSQLDSLAPRPARDKAPEIQDFSLSIGNISIVIDEPKQDAPTLPTPPPIIERPPEVANRPTDLSRYYLDRW